MSKPGHNSRVKAAGPISADRLKSFIERIEKLEEERKSVGGDIKDIYTEAKAVGYDVGTMRKVVRLRAMDAADRAEQETLLDVYWHALQTVDRIDARLAAGESQREVAAAEGVSKTTVQRRGPKVESAPALSKTDHHNPETGEITEAGESCGDAGSASATHNSHHVGHAEGAVAAPPASPHDTITEDAARRLRDHQFGPHDYAMGFVAIGADGYIMFMHCSEGQWQRGRVTVWEGAPVEWRWDIGRAVALSIEPGPHDAKPVCAEIAHTEGEAGIPVSVGAVASESERVAPPFLGDDPGPIPPFLRRTAQGRGA